MSGVMILAMGIGMAALSVVLFIVSVVYRQTTGRKIRKELSEDYE